MTATFGMAALARAEPDRMPPDLADPARDGFGALHPAAPESLLSPREREIAEMVARGLSNKGIALRLGISHWTVSTHLRRVFAKLNINGRVELCRLLTICGRTSAN